MAISRLSTQYNLTIFSTPVIYTDLLNFGDTVMIEQIKLKFCGVSIIERKGIYEMNK